ncbi:hypothetical protein GW756_03475 [bacterium]|nr:hypothetical protein [bacterium]NCQ55421.1 hypothetical protein [Candidatus Parcubacteria bacterium]NCS67783.1 hypothetical protein [Candidatus Peregrinibacteria bacterium]NCS96403.1 hypothetical protein [bacterium]
MFDYFLTIFGWFLSPNFWLIAFVSQIVFQFLLARKLRHSQAWFALVPILNLVQWFQMGRVRARHLLWVLLPFVGVLIFIYKWFVATIKICDRCGERGSFSILLMLPIVRAFALLRLNFKKGFWVKTKTEKILIEKIIGGLESNHTLVILRKFAREHGIPSEEFDPAADKAITIKEGRLKVSHEKYAVPQFISWMALLVFIIFNILLTTVAITKGFGALFNGLGSAIETSLEDMRVPDTANEIEKSDLSLFWFEPNVTSYRLESEGNYLVTGMGTIFKGGVSLGAEIEMYDEELNLLGTGVVSLISPREKANKASGQKVVTAGANDFLDLQVTTQSEIMGVRYMAYGSQQKSKNDAAESLINTNPVFSTQRNSINGNSAMAEGAVLFSDLTTKDKLYVFNRDFEIVNAAKIKKMTLLNSEESITEAAVNDNVVLELELAKDDGGTISYISTLQNLDFLKSYLR